MNRQRAYDILQLNATMTTSIDPYMIKKQFHKLALLYHPDKSKGNEKKFQEISDAYQYLIAKESSPLNESMSYVVVLENFINQLYVNNPTPTRKFAKEIVAIYSDYCSHKDDPTWSLAEQINKLDDDILMPLFEFVCRYKHLLYIATDFIDKMEKYIKNSAQAELVYRLTPTLEDLINSKVYKLVVDDATYFVPLWQPVNYFDVAADTSKEFMVICEPILNDAQQIDEDNNLHIQLHISFDDLRECMTIGGGIYTYNLTSTLTENAPLSLYGLNENDKVFHLQLADLHITTQMQVVRFTREGIPKFDIANAETDKENRGDVVFYVYLY